MTIASRSLPTTRVVAWSFSSSLTFTTWTPGTGSRSSSYSRSIGAYSAYPSTSAVHSASGATRPMSSDSTPPSPCFLRKYDSGSSLYERKVSVSTFRVVISSLGTSPEWKARGVMTVSSVDSITVIRCRARDRQGSTATRSNRSIASPGRPRSTSSTSPIRNWA